MRKHIFNAGPGVLPLEVLKEASESIHEFAGSGQSILEISHRGNLFENVIAEAKLHIRELLGLDNNYEIIFLQGGASMQFAMVPMNFLSEHETSAYIDTGTWSSKAIKEAKIFGNVNVIASSKEQRYNFIPKSFEIPSDAKYLHLTTNNTIYGTQFQNFPETSIPVFADMSSDIFSREIPLNKFDLIYAGAQKNAGPAGVTIVIIKKSLLEKIDKKIPSMLDYRVHVENNSLYNTPAVFSIYVCMLTLRWIKKSGGLKAMEKVNNKKAKKLYDLIDKYPIYNGHAARDDRSKMNVVFTLNKPEFDNEFIDVCNKANITGIKGHRSVGGFRASVYNALSMQSVDVLCEVMEAFGKK